MTDDKFAVLETHEKSHGMWVVTEVASTSMWEVRDEDQSYVAETYLRADAIHIATWSPDVTAEVVENMRKTMELAEHVAATDPGEEISTRSLAMLAEELMDGIDALLAKVKERNNAG